MYKITRIRVRYWLFFLFIQSSYGLNDNQSWASIGFEKKLPYSLKLEFEQELRLKDQLSTFNQTFSEVSLSYKIFNGLNINIPYRYAIFDDKVKRRLGFSGSCKYSFKPISLKYRARFQRTNEKEKNAEDLIRNKFTIEYKLDKKIEPYISGELLYLYKTDHRPLDEYRISFGVAVDLPRKKTIKIFYMYKKEDITKSSSDETNVFGVAYNFKL